MNILKIFFIINSNNDILAAQMSQVAEGTQGVAGVRGTAEDDRRLQRDRATAGDDVTQVYDGSTLGTNRPDH